MKNKIQNSFLSLLALGLLSACGPQHTPSMMNTSPVELARETIVEQISAKNINDADLAVLAEQYRRDSVGTLDLTMTYDPKSTEFTAMNALHGLKSAKMALQQKGIQNISTQTLAVPDGKASLMVSYDRVRAQAPSDCTPMPGLDTNETDRFIGDYRFGCGVETLLAKQIARPSDLEGNAGLGSRDARRDSIVIEDYAAGVPRTELDGLERENLASN